MKFNEFYAQLDQLDYLDSTCVEYARMFASSLKLRLGTDALEEVVPFLALNILVQFSFSRKNICVELNPQVIDEIIMQLAETSITTNFGSDRFVYAEDPAAERQKALGEYLTFWDEALGKGRERVCDGSIDLSSMLSGQLYFVYQGNADDANNISQLLSEIPNTPLVIYEKRSSDGTAVEGRWVYYNLQFVQESAVMQYITSQSAHLGKGLLWDRCPDKSQLGQIIYDLFKEDQSTPDIYQYLAVAVSALSNFSIITGGPGTGKTTTVVKLLFLLSLMSSRELLIAMAAPTGKAANRMKESLIGSLNRFRGEKGLLQQLSQKGYATETLEQRIPTQAQTIHRLIGMNPTSFRCTYNEQNPLPYDVVIIDEASMMDLALFYQLIKALRPDCKLILLGDQDQLPSVEAGSILGDLCRAFLENDNLDYQIRSLELLQQFLKTDLDEQQLAHLVDPAKVGQRCVAAEANVSGNAVKLVHSRRFNAQKGIGSLASVVNRFSDSSDQSEIDSLFAVIADFDIKSKESCSYFSTLWNSDEEKVCGLPVNEELSRQELSRSLRNFLERTDGYRNFLNKLDKLIGVDLSLGVHADKAKDLFASFEHFRVLCTNRESELGVKAINKIYNHKYGSKYKHLKTNSRDDYFWYPGLPIMITKNNHTLSLSNGDIGITMPDPHADDNGELMVLFQMADGTFRYYPTSLLADYEIAYAMTVHKSQGSEATHVLLLTQAKDSSFITKEILYTGITRAKKTITMIYSKKHFPKQCQRKIRRSSNLQQRLSSRLDQLLK